MTEVHVVLRVLCLEFSPLFSGQAGIFHGFFAFRSLTNRRLVDMVHIPLFTRFSTSQVVVWDFFHQCFPSTFSHFFICQKPSCPQNFQRFDPTFSVQFRSMVSLGSQLMGIFLSLCSLISASTPSLTSSLAPLLMLLKLPAANNSLGIWNEHWKQVGPRCSRFNYSKNHFHQSLCLSDSLVWLTTRFLFK